MLREELRVNFPEDRWKPDVRELPPPSLHSPRVCADAEAANSVTASGLARVPCLQGDGLFGMIAAARKG